MFENVGTYTLTANEIAAFDCVREAMKSPQAGKSSQGDQGYALDINWGDKAIFGTQASDYWSGQVEKVQTSAAGVGQSMDSILKESVAWNGSGWRSGASFFDGTLKADDSRVTFTEHNSITAKNGLKADVATVRSDKDAIVSSLVTITKSSGETIEFEATGDVRIQAGKDGSLTVHHLQDNKIVRYMQDGAAQTLESADMDVEGDDSIYIKLTTGSDILGGDGDNSFLIIAGGGKVQGGNGQDNITIGSFVSGETSIDAGAGDDVINASRINSGTVINMGAGNDSIKSGNVYAGAKIDMGEGDDVFQANEIGENAVINMGAGNDALHLKMAMNGVKIDMGEGDDALYGGEIAKGASVIMGSGNDQVNLNRNEGLINLGAGNNVYNEYAPGETDNGNGLIIAEDGDNEINTRIANEIIMGNGNNVIRAMRINSLVGGNGDNAVMSQYLHYARLQDGDNRIMAEKSHDIVLGQGNNVLEINDIGSVTVGNGRNVIYADKTNNDSVISLGGGSNELNINKAFRTTIEAGGGNNNIQIGDTIDASVKVENGNNNIALGHLRANSTLTAGDGDNTVTVKRTGQGANINLGDGNNKLGMASISSHEVNINIGNGDNIVAMMWHPLKNWQDHLPPSVTIGNGNNQIYLEESFKINIGTGSNSYHNFVKGSAGYNAVQAWVDASLNKVTTRGVIWGEV